MTRFLDVEGGRIAFDDTGGAGIPLLAIPGMGDLRGEYRHLSPILRQAGLRVVTMDLRGFGESTAEWDDYSAQAIGRDALALLDHLETDRALILGNSFAAGSALWAAAEAPDRVAGAVLLGPIVRDIPLPPPTRLAFQVGFAGPWRVDFWLSFWDALFPTRKPADHDAYRTRLARNLGEPGRIEALVTMLGLSKKDTASILSTVRVPTLVVMGSRDPDFETPADEALHVAEATGGEALIVEGAGHYSHTDTPEVVASALIDFVRRMDRTAGSRHRPRHDLQRRVPRAGAAGPEPATKDRSAAGEAMAAEPLPGQSLADPPRGVSTTTELSKHVRSFAQGRVIHQSELGTVRELTKAELPLLDRLSIKHVTLQTSAMREPHWHANANELTYCVAGAVLVTVVDSKDGVSRFVVEAGQMFFAASGSLHGFANLGTEPAELIVAFSHERPKDFSLYATFGAMTDAVLGNTFGLPAAAFAPIKRDTSVPYLRRIEGETVPRDARFADPHHFDLGSQTPPVDHEYGTARVARAQFWPILKDIAMYRIDVPDGGMREVHWHPETAEMGYVSKGKARMTVLDPDGSTDTFLLEAGDCYFIPRAYPHQIEVLGEDIQFLIFFDQPTPGDIGLRLAGSALTRPVLAAALGIAEPDLPRLPITPADPLIVAKVNPTDPV